MRRLLHRIGLVLMVPLLAASAVLACGDLSQGPVAALDARAVHQALLRQFEFGEVGVVLVEPLTPELRPDPVPMSADRLAYHRRSGMDIDVELANALARALGGPRLTVDVPSDVPRLKPLDRDRLGTLPDQAFYYAFEGKRAEVVQLYPVAFSEDGTRAVTYLDIWCGPDLCALGLIVLLRRDGVDWVLESQSPVWQS